MDYGYVCDDVEGDEEAKVRKKTEEAMTEALVRTCPSCKAGVLRESGCPHMTCRCGFQFCYACRQPWAGHVCRPTLVSDEQNVESERIKGEAERQRLGVKDRQRIGGDDQTRINGQTRLIGQTRLFGQTMLNG